MRLLRAIVATALATTPIAASPSVQNANPDRVRIGYLNLANGQLVSKSLRLHERALGVPVDWIAFETGGQVNAAMEAGKLDFGALGGPPAAAGISNGLDYTGILILNMLEGVEGLAVKASARVQTPADLVGKRVAVPFGSTSYYLLLSLLAQSGVAEHDVSLLDMTPAEAASAWADGRIDAAYVWEPALGSMLAQGGKILVDNTEMARRGLSMWDVAVVTKSFATAYPALVREFVRSECHAIEYWRANPRQSAARVADELGTTSTIARRMMRGTRLVPCREQTGGVYLGTANAPGRLTKSLWPMARFLSDHGRLTSVKRSSTYEEFFATGFLR